MTRRLLAILLLVLLAPVAERASAQGNTFTANHLDMIAPDSLIITPSMGCVELTVRISRANGSVINLKSLRLDSMTNTRIRTITPYPLAGATEATVVVSPVTEDQDARGWLVLTEADGMVSRVWYSYIAARLDVDAPGRTRDFGRVFAGTATTTRITFTNPVDKTIRIRDLRLLDGTKGFAIVSMIPGPLPVELPKNATITITVMAQPGEANRIYRDSLRIAFDCGSEMTVALNVGSVTGTTAVDDLPDIASPVIVRPNPVIGPSTLWFHLERPVVQNRQSF